MLELTDEQCKELEHRTQERLAKMYPEEDTVSALCKAVVPAIICTLKEYVQMSEGQ